MIKYRNIVKEALRIKNYTNKIKKFIIPTIIVLILIGTSVSVYLSTRKNITISINGTQNKYLTFKKTLREFLDSKNIHIVSKDKVSTSLDSQLYNKEAISIKKAVNIKVTYGGKDIKVLSAEKNVDTMLKAEHLVLNNVDKLSPDKSTKLYEGMKVNIIKVESKTFTDTKPIAFKTVLKYDSGLSNTEKITTNNGQIGQEQISTSVTYENGKEVSRKVVKTTIKKTPVSKVIVIGTFPKMPMTRDGNPVPYSKKFTVRATAYGPINGVGRTSTASGRLAVRNVDGYSTIAVDPNVIPIGTRIFIENYGFAIASDTGTSVLGNTVDLFFNSYSDVSRWAVQYVNLYILK